MTLIAMDVHKGTSTLAFLDPATGQMSTRRVMTSNQDITRALCQWPRPWVTALEATRQAPAVCTWLRELGAQIHLANPQKLSAIGKLRVAKTDAKDAEIMLDALAHDYLPESYLAPPQVVERRALTRCHQVLRGIATQLRNLVRSLLVQAGMDCSYTNLRAKAACEQMPALLERLPRFARLAASCYWQLLEQVQQALSSVDRQITEQAHADPVAKQLMKRPGLGALTALGLMAEIGDILALCRAQAAAQLCGGGAQGRYQRQVPGARPPAQAVQQAPAVSGCPGGPGGDPLSGARPRQRRLRTGQAPVRTQYRQDRRRAGHPHGPVLPLAGPDRPPARRRVRGSSQPPPKQHVVVGARCKRTLTSRRSSSRWPGSSYCAYLVSPGQ